MWSRTWLRVYCALIFAFLMAPLVVVVPVSLSSSEYLQFPPPSLSLKWYQRYLGSADWMAATWRSVQIGLATAALALALGLALAYSVARGGARWLRLTERLVPLPVLIPSMVISVSIYGWFASLRLVGHTGGIVVAHTLLALPYVCLVLIAGLRAIDPTHERAARGLGAGPLAAFAYVTLPQLKAAVATAGIFAFVISFDELVIALFLSGAQATLPKKMFENISFAIDPTIAAVSSLQILLIFVLLAVSGAVGRFSRGTHDFR